MVRDNFTCYKAVRYRYSVPNKTVFYSSFCCHLAFRMMNLHHRLGTSGKHDREHGRAAALLEYIVREEEDGFKIPPKKLAKASFMKDENFVKLHGWVGKFRANSASSTRNTRRTALEESSIPSLAIRLGNFVQDPNGFARRAQNLFQDIQEHAKSMMGVDASRNQLYDMVRYQKAYEAACFFLIATKDKTVVHRHSSDNDGGEEKALDEATILDKCTAFTALEFKLVLRQTETLMEEMKEVASNVVEKVKKVASKEPSAAITKIPESKYAKRAAALVSQKPSKRTKVGAHHSTSRASVDTTTALLEQVENADDSILEDSRRATTEDSSRIPHASPNFLAWKEKTLFEARKMARVEIQKETEEPAADISDDRAIDHAADAVLRRHGLI
jgi:hypothetical protein